MEWPRENLICSRLFLSHILSPSPPLSHTFSLSLILILLVYKDLNSIETTLVFLPWLFYCNLFLYQYSLVLPSALLGPGSTKALFRSENSQHRWRVDCCHLAPIGNLPGLTATLAKVEWVLGVRVYGWIEAPIIRMCKLTLWANCIPIKNSG